MNELEFQNLLTELKRSCNCAFLCDMPDEKDILNAATQIYIEQMRIEAQDANIRQQDLIICIRSQVRAYKINKLAECNTVTEASAIESAIDDIIKILDDWSIDNE